MSAQTMPAPRAATRLLAIDNLRIVLTVMVVIHHVAVTYGNIPLWYYVEPARDPSGRLLDLVVVIDQAFFMGFFFLISGFFTPGSYDRKGARGFVRDRLLRLGVPLLAFTVLLRPLLTWSAYAEHDGMPYWMFYLTSWDPGPMWFVEVLIVFVLGYALWRRAGRPVEARVSVPRPRWIVLFALGLSLVTFLWRFAVPTGTYVPVLGLPSPQCLPQYVAMFAAGLVAFRRGWLETLPRQAARLGFLTAGAVSVTLLPLSLTGGPVSQALMATWESTFAVSLIIALVVWFRDRFDRQGPRGRFLSEQAYTVYVVHPLVLVAVGYALRGLHAVAVVKFAVAVVIALPLCWGLAYLVRSLPGAKRIV
ncbi:peptidoglycan/LPS O-acetylase OafA/YrhL [Nonomuraea muscovyensis]|uniref:Peptidoglycan/LPS O-acetylase OafA/YrhL n=1 Tax=Nonomuraea muscovyensis TaxID=1124761 RepID=A0A7X0EWX1_9ACTN|nr:acyltransferase [Nonomuraea muscovyensis]MBB6346983.1 peptidoglycan/LPS O-acetylase OafA/YrhL [Nonomuraea muscovyensis]